MAQQYRIKRRIASVSTGIADNSIYTVDVPRGYDLESLFFKVTATANLTVGGSAVRALAPTQIIKRVELIGDGKNTIASIPGWYLTKNFGREQFGMMTPPSNFTAAAYPVAFAGSLDQCLVDGVRPKDSNLRTAGMSMLQLRFTFGACTDLFTGTPTGTFTALGLEVYTVETIELPDAKGNVTTPLYLQKRAYQDVSLPSTNANQQIILPIGNALRGVVMLATIAGEPSNAVINNVQLVSGVDVRINLPGSALQAINAIDYAPVGQLVNSSSVDSFNSQVPTGFYYADLMTNGPRDVNVTNAWDLSKASEAKLVLDVTGGAGYQVTVVTTEFLQ
jgi:hypothetical protein